MKNALILSGGGARGAYQVGVLKALAEILPADTHNPFPIIVGTSAGAINAVTLASHAGNFREAVADLESIWADIQVEDIYRSGWLETAKGVFRLGASLFNQGVGLERPISLLDNSPLRELLAKHVDFDKIDGSIACGDLEAVCVTAMGYTSGKSVSFFQGKESFEGWQRYRRVGKRVRLSIDHLMASSAIPTVFPSVRIGQEYFGDGSLRQLSPISPALHLGADRIFIIGVSGNRAPDHWNKEVSTNRSPSMAQIVGHLFNSAFVDSLESDIERLDRINHLLSLIPEEMRDADQLDLRRADRQVISPTEQLDQIAADKVCDLPPSMRFFLGITGATAKGGGAAAASYLMFTPSYCNALIRLGYHDAMWERTGIEAFFNPGLA